MQQEGGQGISESVRGRRGEGGTQGITEGVRELMRG